MKKKTKPKTLKIKPPGPSASWDFKMGYRYAMLQVNEQLYGKRSEVVI